MKLGFEELDHLITLTTLVITILKTMIFVNNFNIAKKITIHLQSQISAKLCNKANILI